MTEPRPASQHVRSFCSDDRWRKRARHPGIAIRLALGAGSGSVRNTVVLQALRLANRRSGHCGLAVAFGLTRLMANLLFGVKALDPVVFSAVPLMLFAVAVVSVWLPALRASRVAPIQALRYE